MTTRRLYHKGERTDEPFHAQVPIECPNCEAPYFFRVFFAGGEGRPSGAPLSNAEKVELLRIGELALNALRETCPQHARSFEC
jgi:hypothetical protein